MTEPYQQEELWRTQIAERVAAHKSRQPAPRHLPRVLPDAPVLDAPAPDPSCDAPRRAANPQQLTQRAVDNVRRRLDARMEREQAERREREELELFFAEFNRPVVSDPAPAAVRPSPSSNLIAFPGATALAPAILEIAEVETAREAAPLPDQLTIFEALAESELELELEPFRPTALRLDEHLDFSSDRDWDRDKDAAKSPEALFDLPLKVAPIALRAWAGIIDGAIVGTCALAFGSIFYGIYHQVPTGRPALAAALAILWVIWVIYQMLFLAYGGSTPGLKVMRLGISTYEDEVPSARTRVKRAIALLFTSMSCGLGFVWTLLDEDRLAWHDRMTRTFPRQLA
ncbi:MAG: RDD family protein [Acidobacteriaceae bacterium]